MRNSTVIAGIIELSSELLARLFDPSDERGTELAVIVLDDRLNCIYCGYANGLLAYAREIAACTEQYWCPIKHARKVLDPHRRYARFADYGDASDYYAHLSEARAQLIEEERAQRVAST